MKRLFNQFSSLSLGGVIATVIALPPAIASSAGGNGIAVAPSACAKGHKVNAADCSYYMQGGKVTVCHFEDHVGDIAVADPSGCGE